MTDPRFTRRQIVNVVESSSAAGRLAYERSIPVMDCFDERTLTIVASERLAGEYGKRSRQS